jgi:nicotinate-nucleotide adenylyltransferase
LRVGLLGGSFNPPHAGHLQISLLAFRRLNLDQVWWLVSPQNPLKPSNDMAPLDQRLTDARAVARDPRIRVTSIEARLGTRFTADTLAALRRRFPFVDFVWLMGADNLAQIPEWRDWERIFHAVPIAIFNRPTYSIEALAGEAARRFRAARIGAKDAATLAGRRPPVWVMIWDSHRPESATALRTGAGDPE